MKALIVLGVSVLLNSVCAAVLAPQPSIADAWSAWHTGDIDRAEEIAAKYADTDEGRHLLTLSACMQGKYTRAEKFYRAIAPSYKKPDTLDAAMFQAYLHLHRYNDAVKLAQDRAMGKVTLANAELRARKPLRVSLNKITEIPFADDPLTPYFPAFSAQINGENTLVHVDTGGDWLVMGPERAKKFHIDLEGAGEGNHAGTKVKVQRGIIKTFTLGDAVLENVPVGVLPTLVGSQDFVVFGTNVLQQFLSTLDYPHKRLILSPRGNRALTQKHLEVHRSKSVEVPFYLWGDHFMFAQGGFGQHKNLNFFVDSGLVSLGESHGKTRQACFVTTPECYRKWGVTDDETQQQFFECEQPISLGPLEQAKQYYTTQPPGLPREFGGVTIDGLISHAFLKEYVWTLDFDRMRYVFSEPGQ